MPSRHPKHINQPISINWPATTMATTTTATTSYFFLWASSSRLTCSCRWRSLEVLSASCLCCKARASCCFFCRAGISRCSCSTRLCRLCTPESVRPLRHWSVRPPRHWSGHRDTRPQRHQSDRPQWHQSGHSDTSQTTETPVRPQWHLSDQSIRPQTPVRPQWHQSGHRDTSQSVRPQWHQSDQTPVNQASDTSQASHATVTPDHRHQSVRSQTPVSQATDTSQPGQTPVRPQRHLKAHYCNTICHSLFCSCFDCLPVWNCSDQTFSLFCSLPEQEKLCKSMKGKDR